MKNGRYAVVLNDDPQWILVDAFAWTRNEDGWVHFTKYFSDEGFHAGKGLSVLSIPEDRIKYIRLDEEGALDEVDELLKKAPKRKALGSFMGPKLRNRPEPSDAGSVPNAPRPTKVAKPPKAPKR